MKEFQKKVLKVKEFEKKESDKKEFEKGEPEKQEFQQNLWKKRKVFNKKKNPSFLHRGVGACHALWCQKSFRRGTPLYTSGAGCLPCPVLLEIFPESK